MHPQTLVVAATRFEVKPLLEKATLLSENVYLAEKHYILIGGVGLMHMAFALSKTLYELPHITQILHIGIAGDYKEEHPLGTVFEITSASYGDLGTLQNDVFHSFYDDGLLNPNTTPFEDGLIRNTGYSALEIPRAHCVNVNLLSTNTKLIKQRFAKAETISRAENILEHMENLAVFYVCSQLKKSFTSLLSSSNRVGDANKEHWEFKTAISNLNKTLSEYLSNSL